MDTNSFLLRHIGPRDEDINEMIDKIGVNSINELIDQTIPPEIRPKKDPIKIENISPPKTPSIVFEGEIGERE